MNWTYTIGHKLKAAVALLVIIVLVLATNMIDKQHFSRLQVAFTSVYEDRLVAENYLFQLSKHLQEKRRSFGRRGQEEITSGNRVNESIDSIMDKYEATSLTVDEAKYFASLQEGFKTLKTMENRLVQGDATEVAPVQDSVNAQFLVIWSDLEALSEIQLVEGARLIKDSRQIIANSNLTSRLEIGVLLVVGLIIQALIFASKPLTSRFPQRSDLN